MAASHVETRRKEISIRFCCWRSGICTHISSEINGYGCVQCSEWARQKRGENFVHFCACIPFTISFYRSRIRSSRPFHICIEMVKRICSLFYIAVYHCKSVSIGLGRWAGWCVDSYSPNTITLEIVWKVAGDGAGNATGRKRWVAIVLFISLKLWQKMMAFFILDTRSLPMGTAIYNAIIWR